LKLHVLSLALPLLAAPLTAEEGMWLPRQIPLLAPQLAAAGLELEPRRLAELTGDPLGAVVSLGGCSASFVSSEGLIVTNHHCITRTLQYNSTPERDLVADGFLAATRADEPQAAPGSYVYVTTELRDVTAEVLAGLSEEVPDAEWDARVERRSRELVDACEAPGGVRCRVASFYEGALFLEIGQIEIRDVRLVYAPAEAIGNFGGEIDNWMWPRHTGDWGFLRAYVGPDGRPADPSPANVPYRPRRWLEVSTEGVEEGDLVWIAGYPGRTYRYRTAAEVRAAREFEMPEYVRWARALITLLEREDERGREVALANYGRQRGYANAMKKYEGILLGLRDGAVERQRAEREAAMRAADGLGPATADVLDQLAAWTARGRERERLDHALDWLGRSSPMLDQAIELWRFAEERAKPDLERAEGYRERDRTRFEQALARAQRSIEPGSDRATLRWALEQALDLPAGQRIAALDRKLAATAVPDDAARLEALLDTLYGGTRIGDLAERQRMAAETGERLAARGDAMLDFARELAPELAARRAFEGERRGAMLRLRPRYLGALERAEGGRLYPDANSTLRFTYGVVTGYAPRDAVRYLPRTTLGGLLAKATGQKPFAPPATLLAAAGRVPRPYIDSRLGDVPVDFLSTCDITGGNSGSPTLDARGRLVGLAFDGNYEGVVSDYRFDSELARTIQVDATYMRFVMDAVDRAHHLLREMGLPVYTAE